MGNLFSGGGRDMKCSNGATEAFLTTLQFALSDLASTPWERAVAQGIAWHDQNYSGIGTVGFELEEIPWDPAEFTEQKAFLIRSIDLALTHYRWAELNYDPSFADRDLARFRQIVELFELPPEVPEGYGSVWHGTGDWEQVCDAHGIHCPDTGWCRVCADHGLDGSGGIEGTTTSM